MTNIHRGAGIVSGCGGDEGEGCCEEDYKVMAVLDRLGFWMTGFVQQNLNYQEGFPVL